MCSGAHILRDAFWVELHNITEGVVIIIFKSNFIDL